MLDIFRSAIFAGICISVGGIVNLTVGGIAGAVLFAFGLLTVVSYSLKLYTGTAGFISNTRKDFGTLLFCRKKDLCCHLQTYGVNLALDRVLRVRKIFLRRLVL